MTQDDIEEIKNIMLKGAIPLECKKCASLEVEHISSPRAQYLEEFPDHSNLQYLDLVLNNDCNLECLMCSPIYSYRLNKIYSETSPDEMSPSWRIDLDKIEEYDLSNITTINIIGGEPLISKDSHHFLVNFLKNHRLKKLRIISNFTKLPDHWKEIFQGVDQLELIASIDATDSLYEFIRYPAQFERIKSSLDKLKSWNIKGLHLRQHVVLMALNIGQLREIINFHEEYFTSPNHRLPIFVEISSPQVLHPSVLPKKQWSEIKSSFLQTINELITKYGDRSEFEDLIKLIDKMERIDLSRLYVDYHIYLQKIKKHHS